MRTSNLLACAWRVAKHKLATWIRLNVVRTEDRTLAVELCDLRRPRKLTQLSGGHLPFPVRRGILVRRADPAQEWSLEYLILLQHSAGHRRLARKLGHKPS